MKRLIIITAIVIAAAAAQAQGTEPTPINYEEQFLEVSKKNVELQAQIINCQSSLAQYTLPQTMKAIEKRQAEIKAAAGWDLKPAESDEETNKEKSK